jgi:isopenicillin N synthase-like dioxygenase
MSSLKQLRSVVPTIISYSDLCSPLSLSSQLSAAFDDSSLGLLAISDIPNYSSARFSLLSQARSLYFLPQPAKDNLLCPGSCYKVGCSNGHEVYKGQTNSSQSNFHAFFKDRLDFPNLWPAALPAFRPAFEQFSSLVHSTAALLLGHIDRLLDDVYQATFLQCRSRLSKETGPWDC